MGLFLKSFCLYLDNYHYLYTYLSSAVRCLLCKISVETLSVKIAAGLCLNAQCLCKTTSGVHTR